MKKLKLVLAFFLVFQVVFTTTIVSAASNDISGHWAEGTITKWLEAGTIKGYEDGSFKPNQAVTRAEFIKILNHTFNVEEVSDKPLSFIDVPSSHWAYNDIAMAIHAGYVSGTGEDTFSPNVKITRQESAVMLANLLKLEGESEVAFNDATEIASWSKIAIATLASKGILEGDPKGNVRPRANLTRAEAVVLVDKASDKAETVFSVAGTYGNEQTETVIEGHVRITASGVKLLNTKITGNLTVDKAVGEGDVYLTKVEVLGETIVQGGGENSIHLEDSVLIRIIADKATGTVRIVAIGSTTVQEVYVRSAIKLEESHTSGSGFNNVELSSALPVGSKVDLVGHFESVSVLASNIKVNIPSGTINKLEVAEQAKDNAITLDKNATVLSLLLNIAAQLLGEGTIEKAIIGEKAGESSFSQQPKSIDGDASKIVILPPVAAPPVVAPPSGGTPPQPETPTPQPETPTPPQPETPTPTPKPPVTPNPGTGSSDATLHHATFTSDVNFVFVQTQLSATVTEAVYEFSPTHFQYTTTIPSGSSSYNVTLNLEHDQNAIVFAYYIKDGIHTPSLSTNSNGEYTFTVDSSVMQRLNVNVYSSNFVSSKHYEFYFVPEYNIQSNFKLSGTEYYKYLRSDMILSGDTVNVTIPAEHSSTNQDEVVSYTNQSYNTGTVSGTYINLWHLAPSSQTGKLKVEIIRDNKVIASGDYHFDTTLVDVNIADSSIITFKFDTKEELKQLDLRSNTVYKSVYGGKVIIDKAKIENMYGSNVYFTFISSNNYYEQIMKDEAKIIQNTNKHALSNIYNDTLMNWHRVYNPLDYGSGTYYVNQEKVQYIIGLYNEQNELLTLYGLSQDIPQSALGENVEFAQ